MRPIRTIAPLAALLLVATGFTACVTPATGSGAGTFDRELAVTGPVVLEVMNGSGDVQIVPGASGSVHVHGEFRVRTMLLWGNVQQRTTELTQHPPIEQEGNLIRIGQGRQTRGDLTVNYTITVPAETELRGTMGSSDLQVRGIHGPARLTIGSGNVTAEQIGEDTQVTAGSGDIRLRNIQGEVQVTTGSGDVQLSDVHGEIRVHTGSGDITIERPGNTITAGAGSGDVVLRGISGDARVKTGSGDITVDGDPAGTSYWEFHTGSGEVGVHVPSASSFRFYARTSSGKIATAIPMVVEQQLKHELHARVNDGKGRVEVETSSGDISVN
jgi:Putative adhesin